MDSIKYSYLYMLSVHLFVVNRRVYGKDNKADIAISPRYCLVLMFYCCLITVLNAEIKYACL